jgi:transposase
MRSYIDGVEHIIFDGTSLVTKSNQMNISRHGYNAHREYEPQINLLYAFSSDEKSPVYYRIVPGNIRDVSALKLSIKETNLKGLIFIGDKGFGSKTNFELLEENGIQYIVPLKRNSNLYESSKLEKGNKAEFDGYFLFNKRPIWYYTNPEVIIYLDNDLKNEEEKDYIARIESNAEGYTKESFIERQYKFGVMVIKTNLNRTPQEIYTLYKGRREIEQSFDFLKNLLEQDKTNMQNEQSLETWAFINHLSLILNYRVYNLLRIRKQLSKYSVADFIHHLKYIFKVKAGSSWYTSEITEKTRELLALLDLHIT